MRGIRFLWHHTLMAGLALLMFGVVVQAAPAIEEREPVTLSVVVVNPSVEKAQVIPVRIDLPAEITPKDVLNTGDLELEYDDERAGYYVYRNDVALQPKETRVYTVKVNDVWYIPSTDLESLRKYSDLLLGRIEGTEYYSTAQQLAETIEDRLVQVEAVQSDDSLSRKSRIGAYRKHLTVLEGVKEDLARMEKLLTFIGGPPVPEMLEDSPMKSDAPSDTTTWLIIFLVIIFIAMIGLTFFFTWNRRTQVTDDIAVMRQATYQGSNDANKN